MVAACEECPSCSCVDHVAEGVRFRLTDGVSVVDVQHRGEPPELFADGAPIVCEGTWEGASFRSDRLMIKHGSEYEPPEVLDPATDTVVAEDVES